MLKYYYSSKRVDAKPAVETFEVHGTGGDDLLTQFELFAESLNNCVVEM